MENLDNVYVGNDEQEETAVSNRKEDLTTNSSSSAAKRTQSPAKTSIGPLESSGSEEEDNDDSDDNGDDVPVTGIPKLNLQLVVNTIDDDTRDEYEYYNSSSHRDFLYPRTVHNGTMLLSDMKSSTAAISTPMYTKMVSAAIPVSPIVRSPRNSNRIVKRDSHKGLSKLNESTISLIKSKSKLESWMDKMKEESTLNTSRIKISNEKEKVIVPLLETNYDPNYEKRYCEWREKKGKSNNVSLLAYSQRRKMKMKERTSALYERDRMVLPPPPPSSSNETTRKSRVKSANIEKTTVSLTELLKDKTKQISQSSTAQCGANHEIIQRSIVDSSVTDIRSISPIVTKRQLERSETSPTRFQQTPGSLMIGEEQFPAPSATLDSSHDNIDNKRQVNPEIERLQQEWQKLINLADKGLLENTMDRNPTYLQEELASPSDKLQRVIQTTRKKHENRKHRNERMKNYLLDEEERQNGNPTMSESEVMNGEEEDMTLFQKVAREEMDENVTRQLEELKQSSFAIDEYLNHLRNKRNNSTNGKTNKKLLPEPRSGSEQPVVQSIPRIEVNYQPQYSMSAPSTSAIQGRLDAIKQRAAEKQVARQVKTETQLQSNVQPGMNSNDPLADQLEESSEQKTNNDVTSRIEEIRRIAFRRLSKRKQQRETAEGSSVQTATTTRDDKLATEDEKRHSEHTQQNRYYFETAQGIIEVLKKRLLSDENMEDLLTELISDGNIQLLNFIMTDQSARDSVVSIVSELIASKLLDQDPDHTPQKSRAHNQRKPSDTRLTMPRKHSQLYEDVKEVIDKLTSDDFMVAGSTGSLVKNLTEHYLTQRNLALEVKDSLSLFN